MYLKRAIVFCLVELSEKQHTSSAPMYFNITEKYFETASTEREFEM